MKKKSVERSAKTPARKRRSASAAPSVTQQSYEHVRIVPLHIPKPTVSVGEIRGMDEGDLFDGKPRIAPPNVNLTYRNGPLLTAVQVYTVFWGTQWASAPSAQPLITGLNQFFHDILTSSLIDQLKEYSVPGKAIGHGKFLGSKTISANAPTGSISDSKVAARLKQWIKAGTVPKPTANSLYFIYLDPGVVSIMGGSKSCQNYCGYHSNTGSVYYSLMPYPTCSGCLGGLALLDALTGTSSHELCEAITDPVPGSGWYDDTNGEIGDICAWNFKKIGSHNVQLEWSNKAGKCL